MAQSDLSVKDRRGAIGASSSRSRLGDSHSETPHSVIKEPGITLSNPKLLLHATYLSQRIFKQYTRYIQIYIKEIIYEN